MDEDDLISNFLDGTYTVSLRDDFNFGSFLRILLCAQ